MDKFYKADWASKSMFGVLWVVALGLGISLAANALPDFC